MCEYDINSYIKTVYQICYKILNDFLIIIMNCDFYVGNKIFAYVLFQKLK